VGRAQLAALLVAAALSGCATASPSRLGVRERIDERSVVVEPLRFEDETGFAFIDGRTGRALSFAEVARRVREAELVLVGEQHDEPAHHALERRVVGAAVRERPGAVVGLEMVSWSGQGALDRYASGELDAAGLAAALDWKRSWGHDFELYRPIFDDAVKLGARFAALNAPRALVHAVATKGVAGLSAEERAQLPELDLDDSEHRLQIRAMFGGAGHEERDEAFDRLYAAQVVWDESMADRARAWLAEGDGTIVILAGNGHCHDSAIVRRLARRGGTPALSIRPLVDDGEGNVARALAEATNDYLFVMTASSPRPATATPE